MRMNDGFELAVVRHGRTAWNASGRFQGMEDVPLDDTGNAQARAIAAIFAPERIDALLTSPLQRAFATAAEIGAPHGLRPQADSRWREMAFGVWEGLTWKEIIASYPEAAKPPAGELFATPEGGESFAAVCERVAAVYADLRARFTRGERVVLATHAGVLHALLRVVLGDESKALAVRFTPASVSRFRIAADGSASVIALNQTPGDSHGALTAQSGRT